MRIGEHSGLRKLMRAARRGRVPQERIGVIVRAMQSAVAREASYANSCPLKRLYEDSRAVQVAKLTMSSEYGAVRA